MPPHRASTTTSATWVSQYTRFSATFRDVFARNGVAHAQKDRNERRYKHGNTLRKKLRQVMRRRLCSKGRKMATNYLSGTTFILSNDRQVLCHVPPISGQIFHPTGRQTPRSRGLSERGAFSCEERCIPAHMQGWGCPLEEDFGQKCQRWVVTRNSTWHCEPDDDNIAVFKRTLLSILHSNREQIISSDSKIAWFNRSLSRGVATPTRVQNRT
jgi:hypothetical protein